ncbi:MAG TPA: hypothetical protein VFR77_06525 [Steroidobacteraceae bacterium]|nr:hypothetical protein [Steroidobacteraceae bacterium]
MANETTTATLDDITHASLIEPVMIAALSEKPGFWRFCREFDIRNKSTNAAKIPIENAWWGSPDDNGAGVDTEFNAAQATEIPNTAASTSGATITAAEYGIAIEVTDNAQEDSIDGLDMMNHFESRMLHVLSLAMDDDFIALFASLSNVVGTTTVDLSIAQLLAAQTGIRTRGTDAPDGVAYILDTQQGLDVENAFISTSASAAVFAFAADRIINYTPAPNHGMSNRQIATFRGYPVWVSGLCDTANAGADAVGACFVPSSPANDTAGHTTFGMCWKRLPRFETERHAKKRTTDLVMTARAGFGEMVDGSGTNITTDVD